jgi:ribosomal subunit interface protein
MVQNLDFHSVHTSLDEELKSYIERKLKGLDKYVSASARRSMRVEIFAKENKAHGGKRYEFEVIVNLPKDTIRIREDAIEMRAAVDIVEEKLKQALIKYKEMHGNPKRWRHLLKRSLEKNQ